MKNNLLKLHVAVFLWGFTGVLGRVITLNEGLLVWYRLLFTVITLFLILFVRKELKFPPFREAKKPLLIGVVIAFHWVLFYGSIKYSNVSIALICLSAAGIFTALIEPFMMKRKMVLAEILLGLLGLLGIFLIFHFDQRYKTGIILGVISTLMIVYFSIQNKKLLRTNSPKQLTFLELTGGLLGWSLFLPFYNYLFPSESLIPGLTDVIWLLTLSWFCTILAFFLSLSALRSISAFTLNLTLNLEPVYGIILAFIFYQENKDLGEWFFIGFTLIIISVVLQTIRLIRKKGI